MFINDVSLVRFNKEKKKKKEKDNKILKNIKGTGLIGTGGAIGIQSIRSGVPRLLGVRLEQHGTSKEAAKNIIKEGYLDPAYGGSQGGVTASMLLPKEFLERSKGHTFLSGKNSTHPFYKDRVPFLSDVGDVITRKIQVLGYRGSKAGKINIDDVNNNSKFLASKISGLIKPIEKKLNELTPEKYLADVKKQADLEINAGKPGFYKGYYEQLSNDPEKLKKEVQQNKKVFNKIIKGLKSLEKQGYNDSTRVKAIRKTQSKYKKLLSEYLDDIKQNQKNSTNIVKDWDTDKILKADTNKQRLTDFLIKQSKQNNDRKAERLLKLQNSLSEQLSNQKASKYLGLSAAWSKKLLTSPGLGLLGVGKTLYLPGTDDYFNDPNKFKYDPDDPFGNPLKYQKALTSDAGGMGGNALKTKEKVRAFGNRFSASKYLLEKEGDGNILKGAGKLIKNNPKRVLAGATILGLGGYTAKNLINKGLNLIKEKDKPRKRIIRVKSSIRNGKIVKAFNRLNPFYNKNIKN